MYAAVVRFRFRAPVSEADMTRIEQEVIDPTTRLAGFRMNIGIRVTDTEAIAVHLWDSREDFERALPQLMALTQQGIGAQLAGPPERTAGEVLVYHQR